MYEPVINRSSFGDLSRTLICRSPATPAHAGQNERFWATERRAMGHPPVGFERIGTTRTSPDQFADRGDRALQSGQQYASG